MTDSFGQLWGFPLVEIRDNLSDGILFVKSQLKFNACNRLYNVFKAK